eukprot:SAG22_NODE_1001_length_6086_cov_3.870887_4_plen_37_part_00
MHAYRYCIYQACSAARMHALKLHCHAALAAAAALRG